MKIVRQTESEIVVEESSRWMAGLCALCAAFILTLALLYSQYKSMAVGIFILLIGLLCLRRSTFSFGATTKSVHWTRLRMVKKETGDIPFSDVRDIIIESSATGTSQPRCRLTFRTFAQSIPLSDGYNTSRDHAATMRNTLLAFMTADTPKPADSIPTINTDAVRTQQLNDSIRSLLRQGKKFDAILLVQQTEHLDLTEATFRVNQVANQKGVKQPASKA